MATGMVVLLWVSALLGGRGRRRGGRWPSPPAPCALLLIDPIVYGTAAEDFHFEPLAMCFVVLAAYDLWSGRTTRMWVWAGLCLLCGDIGGLYLVGLGLTGVVAARGNRSGRSSSWWWARSGSPSSPALGANLGSDVTTGYAYLAGRSVLPNGARGLVLVARGHRRPPGPRLARGLAPQGRGVRLPRGPAEVSALLTPWGFGVPLVVLGASGLQLTSVFIGVRFQNVVVVPFVTFGTAWLVVWIATRWRVWPAAVLAAVVGVRPWWPAAPRPSSSFRPPSPSTPRTGSSPATRRPALRQALDAVPPGAEAIVSVPIMGRFAQRKYVYAAIDPALHSSPPLPVHGGTVAVVIDETDAPRLLPPAVADQLRAELVARGARVVVDSHGILAIVWHPPPGTTDLPLP